MAEGSVWESVFVGVLLSVMFVCLFKGIKTPETVVFIALCVVWNVGIISTQDALSGFNNRGCLTVGALFVVVKGVERSQLADKAARKVFGLKTSRSMGMLRMCVLVFFLSAFLNNTPVVALLIPIVRDWARTRGFAPSHFLIPLSYSCIMGGVLTIIGTSTNLVIQGLLSDNNLPGFSFFEPAYVGLPLGLLGIAYLVVAAPRLLPTRGGLFRFVRDRADELLTEVEVSDSFMYVGNPVSKVLDKLGLASETLIKIRRPVRQHMIASDRRSKREGMAIAGEAAAAVGDTATEGGAGGSPVPAAALNTLGEGCASPAVGDTAAGEGGGADGETRGEENLLKDGRERAATITGFGSDRGISSEQNLGTTPGVLVRAHSTSTPSVVANAATNGGNPRSKSKQKSMVCELHYYAQRVGDKWGIKGDLSAAAVGCDGRRPESPEQAAAATAATTTTSHLHAGRESNGNGAISSHPHRQQQQEGQEEGGHAAAGAAGATTGAADGVASSGGGDTSSQLPRPSGLGSDSSPAGGRGKKQSEQAGNAASTSTPTPTSTSPGTAARQGGTEGGSLMGYSDIYPVSPSQTVMAGDILFLSCGRNAMIELQGAASINPDLQGLKLLDVSALDLPGKGSDFFELVISDRNYFATQTFCDFDFGDHYGCTVVASRRKGAAIDGGPTSVSAAPPSPTSPQGEGRHLGAERRSWRRGGARGAVGEAAFGGEAVGDDAKTTNGTHEAVVALHTNDYNSRMMEAGEEGAGAGGIGETLRFRLTSLLGGGGTRSCYKAGDVVLVLAKNDFEKRWAQTQEFFLITQVGSIPLPTTWFDFVPLYFFLGLLLWVLTESADMVRAAFTIAALLVAGGWVSAKRAVTYVNWGLLLLIGSSLGLSRAIENSGLAGYVGSGIRSSGIAPEGIVFVLYLFTMCMTELITNNAAAALALPIGLKVAEAVEVDFRPFAMVIMLAASSSFLSPIGYQTNTMVWGPGGYAFTDFAKIGFPLSILYMVGTCFFVPLIWPL